MLRFIKSTLNPDCYHGSGKKPPFFEGWYYKLVDAAGNRSLAIIPGIFLSSDPGESISFVQVFDGRSGQVWFVKYASGAFRDHFPHFDVEVAENRFTAHSLSLDIREPGLRVYGELRFPEPRPWPITLASPGIMGWYAWAPFMQCYHGVVSMDHYIEGTMTLNNEVIDFNGGRGYTEKDWGRAFPASWVWLQSNHFDQAEISLTLSVAEIPWIRGEFPGFIIGFWFRSKLYRFATYTGATIQHFDVNDRRIHLRVRNKSHLLDIRAYPSENRGMLYGPNETGMHRRVAETIDARVAVRLYRVKTPQSLVYSGIGAQAGLEAVGDLASLVALWQRDTSNPKRNKSPKTNINIR